jgi:hypothetical protein
MNFNGAILRSSNKGDCLRSPAYINSYLDRISHLEVWYGYSQLLQSSGDRLDDSCEEKN